MVRIKSPLILSLQADYSLHINHYVITSSKIYIVDVNIILL